jgi:hypothetical protein
LKWWKIEEREQRKGSDRDIKLPAPDELTGDTEDKPSRAEQSKPELPATNSDE